MTAVNYTQGIAGPSQGRQAQASVALVSAGPIKEANPAGLPLDWLLCATGRWGALAYPSWRPAPRLPSHPSLGDHLG